LYQVGFNVTLNMQIVSDRVISASVLTSVQNTQPCQSITRLILY